MCTKRSVPSVIGRPMPSNAPTVETTPWKMRRRSATDSPFIFGSEVNAARASSVTTMEENKSRKAGQSSNFPENSGIWIRGNTLREVACPALLFESLRTFGSSSFSSYSRSLVLCWM
ncbi:uncharacterized protein LOC112462369 [Temnothorax curvispinosus]|uniref:Uncharacterized protein LOC112462369 n=1 Tax=Temnothorax curvispinosus TaxID=300111 RepID=A0A6J1QN45_9HYME|nr:uncharacterized protein LOC112462369 [Temnothorax curvispinosus]